MKRITIVFCILAVITGILWFAILDYHFKRKEVILDSWNNLQLQIVRAAGRSAEAWLEAGIAERGSDRKTAEQEIYEKFIEPIVLLQSGAAWFYNRDYVIYDNDTDFPDIYKNKNMREIFDVQENNGARHYEEMCEGVIKGKAGMGWYVWRPDKGREFAAWSPVRFGDDVWTVGLSTPENEIHEHFGIPGRFKRELTGGIFITLLIFAVLFLVYQQYRRDRAVMKLLKEKSLELGRTNKELVFQLGERERAEKERKRLSEELEKKYREERDAWKEISFRAAHKVGNAIFGLRGEIDWLRNVFEKKPINEEEMASAIREAGEGLKEANAIVREFKKYYRPDQLRLEQVRINEVLENAMSQVEKALGENVVIEKALAENLPLIEMDKTKFKQCMTELIENACHFMYYQGTITIRSETAAADEKKRVGIKGNAIAVSIKDTGTGVSEDNKTMLFHPFFSTSAKGSGMGLAIVRQYVELHGGRIAEIGEYGEGAEFLILMPYHSAV